MSDKKISAKTGLYLCFGEDAPAWREDCEVCHGTGQVPYRIFTDDGLKDTGDLIACYECSHDDEYCKVGGHGTGSVEYRLAGRGRIGFNEGFIWTIEETPKALLPLDSTPVSNDIAIQDLAICLIDRFRDNTLPAPLLQSDTNPDGLYKVEIEGETE